MKKIKKVLSNVTFMRNAEMKEIVGGQVAGEQYVCRYSYCGLTTISALYYRKYKP